MSQPPYPPQQQGQWPPPPPPDGPGAPGDPGGPGGFGGHYGQFGPPKKSKTGLIIALVAVGVLVLGGLAAGGILAFSGGDDESASSDESSETAKTDEASGEPTEEAAPPAEGDIVGKGYHYSLPDGWQDISDGSEVSAQPSLDTGSANGPSIQGATANLLVETGAAGGLSSEQLHDQLKSTYESQFDVEVEELAARDVGGESMSVLTLTRPNPIDDSIEVKQVSYVAVREDTGFVITASRVTSASDSEAEIEQILDSWAWD